MISTPRNGPPGPVAMVSGTAPSSPSTSSPSTSGAATASTQGRRVVSTPIGSLELVAGPAGLRAVLWPGEDGSRVPRSVGVQPQPGGADGVGDEAGDATQRHLDAAQAQLAEYFDGTRREFDLVLDPAGTDFQLRVWNVLRSIPYGRTISYGAQATALGDPGAARAVGAANGRNPLSIVVPCHRVVSASGGLTGFAGGLDTKAWLLEHERTVLAGA